ncbi:Tol-Pal system TolQ [Tepidicaulis marinus]|uniref:Tol-Pal system protein TolQ n=1 Tax=Tepidicaulis marinus TaxID=1333998 RepID=A0A081BEU3_9HYPH|nr:protein TolQ [Tepidicaulis marinus]GAK46561.1 Tol-Pal system TolQ [Tepidicaulis marinus]
MDPTRANEVLTDVTVDAGPLDFSLWSLFLRADWVVKMVMLGLFFASVWSWAIIFDKWWRVSRLRKRADQFERLFWSGRSLDEIYDDVGHRPGHPLSTLFVAAMREWKRSNESGAPFAGLRERVDKVMTITINREMMSLESNLLFLATVGATAPFIGLFGTVWGIMNSFQSIAISRDTNLAVVAPGIAEALFATALGLVAAIPAVIAYNKFSSEIGRFGSRLEDFADEFSAIVSRQIDERR